MSDSEPRVEPTRVMTPAGAVPVDRTMVAPVGGIAPTQMPGAGFGGDAFRTQMNMTQTCPVCKASTPATEQYCGDCGFLLSSSTGETIEVPIEEAPAAELVDPNDGRRYRLRNGVNTLGRQGTDILLNEGTISRVHARFMVDNGAVSVEDLGSSNGTKVGDRRISANQPTPVPHGTPLKFGNWRVMLEVAGADPVPQGGGVEATIAIPASDRTIVNGSDETVAPQPASAPSLSPAAPAELTGPVIALLQLIDGPGQEISIREGTVTIGRRPSNTISLPQDAYISGRHAEIITDNTGTYLVDLGSTNGTVVNGKKLPANERQLLLDGDEVQLGQGKYRFLLVEESGTEAEAAAAPAPAADMEAESASEQPAEEETA